MPETKPELPLGTVTYLFTDIEGSTPLVAQVGPEVYGELLDRHHQLMRGAIAAHQGVERGTEGDSFLVVFRDAPSAVATAVEAQRALAAAEWPAGVDVRVRMGLHSGRGIAGGDGYVCLDINQAARIASVAQDASSRALLTGLDWNGTSRIAGPASPGTYLNQKSCGEPSPVSSMRLWHATWKMLGPRSSAPCRAAGTSGSPATTTSGTSGSCLRSE